MKVKVALTEEEKSICYELRETIFIKGQNVPEIRERDEFDKTATHFLLLHKEEPVGVGRVSLVDNRQKIERVGVLKDYRKIGAGKFLMEEIIEHCKKEPKDILLSAQEHAVEFYEKLGFKAFGEKFLDAGIPHFNMRFKN